MQVILIDDEQTVRDSARQWLELSDFKVMDFGDAESALNMITTDYPGIVLSDVKMPGLDGLGLQKKIAAVDPHIPVVLFTGHGDIAMAVEAIRGGAYDFVEKPFDPEQIIETIKRALEKRRLILENRELRKELKNNESLDSRLIGTCNPMRELKREMAHIAPTVANVLLLGETGTGKEVIARSIHEMSDRKKGAYLALNCSAIPLSMAESELFGHKNGAFTGARGDRTGKLEAASGGTLFLDEINSMPLDIQSKLLRALECREITPLGSNTPVSVEFRLISAMNEDPRKAIAEGRLREDLYFRLNTVELTVPPLRDRTEDIPLLFSFFLERAADTYGRSADSVPTASMAIMMSHNWPGNVRELKNLAERFVLSGMAVGERIPKLLSEKAMDNHDPSMSLREQVNLFERHLIQKALARHAWNIKDVMDELHTPRRTLNEKMQRYGLKRT